MFIPNMIMIGATGRNTGKTLLACALIKQLRRQQRVIGVKITSVDDTETVCPRGGAGCGVCAALTGPYEISLETQADSPKDTGRLLNAGAEQVFWVKTRRSQALAAMQALIDRVGDDVVMVCESTGLRRVVEPGLFLLTRGDAEEDMRPSARIVGHLADRVVTFNGRSLDVDITRIHFAQGRWQYPARASAVILAGGASRRMGRDKSMLPIKGTSLIAHILEQVQPAFDQVIVSSNAPHKHDFLEVPIVSDPEQGRGPLMGICTALQEIEHEYAFVCACDMPQIDIRLAHHLIRQAPSYDAVIPCSGPQRFEPLFAVYGRSLIGAMQQTLSRGRNRILDALVSSRVRYVDLTEAQARSMQNLNTGKDYQIFLASRKH